MKCKFCGLGIAVGVSLYRFNEKGENIEPIWSCYTCNPTMRIDPEVKQIVETIEKANTMIIEHAFNPKNHDWKDIVDWLSQVTSMARRASEEEIAETNPNDRTWVDESLSKIDNLIKCVQEVMEVYRPLSSWPHSSKWGGNLLLSKARDLLEHIEHLPASIQASQLTQHASTVAHAIQELQRTGEYQWPTPITNKSMTEDESLTYLAMAARMMPRPNIQISVNPSLNSTFAASNKTAWDTWRINVVEAAKQLKLAHEQMLKEVENGD